MTDHWLGVFLERLGWLGLESNTVIALVADHGILLGDHGWTGKVAAMLHPPLTHVPFILVDPAGGRHGETSDRLAQTHDIGPTLLSIAGVRPPRGMDGLDLRARRRPPPRLRRVRKLALRAHGRDRLRLVEPRSRPAPLRPRPRSGRAPQPRPAAPEEDRRALSGSLWTAPAGVFRSTVSRPMPVTRRRFIQASTAAAATTALDTGAFASDPGRAERAPRDRRLAARRRRLRRLGAHAEHGRARPPRAALHAGLPRGDAHRPGPQLHPQRAARSSRSAAGTTAAASSTRPGWEPLDRLDRSLLASLRRAGYWTAYVTDNPFLGLRTAVRPLPQQRQPLRSHGRPDRRPPASRRACRTTSSATGSIPRYDDAQARARVGQVPGQQPPMGGADTPSPAASSATRIRRAERRRGAAPARSRWWWTPTSRTSPGHRRARFLDPYGELGMRPRARPCRATAGSRAGCSAPRARRRVIGRMRDLYAAEVTMTDHWLGNLIDRLHDLNLERETVIALVGDHGISARRARLDREGRRRRSTPCSRACR